ncbi:hypothetical protein JK159_02240 [Weissella minor]|uniref:hypothetical protein n=1 Tax=Weissella minor TaxID=1620 RepID=UPI001BB0CEAC|nr:hypothetical protein [Weissella minor]MBS0949202.1 hypothetical protein [Weissella minor]
MQSKLMQTAPRAFEADFTQPEGMSVAYRYYLGNGEYYFSLETIGDTDEVRQPTMKDWMMNYWYLPLERKIKLIGWWGAKCMTKVRKWIQLYLERLLHRFVKWCLPIAGGLTIVALLRAGEEKLEETMAFKTITISQLWKASMSFPVGNVFFVFGLILGMLTILMAIASVRGMVVRYANTVTPSVYMPSYLTFWEQKEGALIPHNYFKDEYNFEKFWQGNTLPEDLQQLRFRDRFMNGVDANQDRIQMVGQALPIPFDYVEWRKISDQPDAHMTDVDFLKQFQFMSRQLNHLNDYTISDSLHKRQKQHY